jgi:hypothetical protein
MLGRLVTGVVVSLVAIVFSRMGIFSNVPARAQMFTGSTQFIASMSAPYRQYTDAGPFKIAVPQYVELRFDQGVSFTDQALVIDLTTGEVQSSLSHPIDQFPHSSSTIVTSMGDGSAMVDGNLNTYDEFNADPHGDVQYLYTELNYPAPITSDQLIITLDRNVVPPISIDIGAVVNGTKRLIFEKSPVSEEGIINFPRTTASQWMVNFSYSQLLRIAEISLTQESNPIMYHTVRFLAQPGHVYRVYVNADNNSAFVGGVASVAGTAPISSVTMVGSLQANPNYVATDSDGDGIPDVRDNCSSVPNPDQLDADHNGIGDACEDFDNDGVMNSKDNCPSVHNPNQKDTDGDGIGDACDSTDNRITEQYPWLPWVGIGVAVVVLMVLIVLTAMGKRPEDSGGNHAES